MDSIIFKNANVRFYLSYGMKITLKSHLNKVKILSLCPQRFKDVALSHNVANTFVVVYRCKCMALFYS